MKNEKWYLAIVDVIAVLTNSPNPQVYWRVLKKRLKDEGNEAVTNCNGLKMVAPDGKMRMTDVADTEQLFRLIQSIPSPKAEPFKLWLAQVAADRLDEMQDPELTIDRAMKEYLQLGYSENWINQRLKSIEVRKELTDEWKNAATRKEFNLLRLPISLLRHGVTRRRNKRLEERKSSGQYDQYSTDFEHACLQKHLQKIFLRQPIRKILMKVKT